jgi:hypothetical protein
MLATFVVVLLQFQRRLPALVVAENAKTAALMAAFAFCGAVLENVTLMTPDVEVFTLDT